MAYLYNGTLYNNEEETTLLYSRTQMNLTGMLYRLLGSTHWYSIYVEFKNRLSSLSQQWFFSTAAKRQKDVSFSRGYGQ